MQEQKKIKLPGPTLGQQEKAKTGKSIKAPDIEGVLADVDAALKKAKTVQAQLEQEKLERAATRVKKSGCCGCCVE